MDGLLIDSEDAYTRVTNTILRECGRPDLPWSIKAQLQGRPGTEAGRIFQEWAKLPISMEDFQKRQSELQAQEFPHSKPLPGVEKLLTTLSDARTRKETSRNSSLQNGERASRMTSPVAFNRGRRIRMAVATSSVTRNFDIKTKHLKPMFSVFPEQLVIKGDDPRIPRGRGKPLPDIYLLALQVINDTIRQEDQGERLITPEECLVFEDSVPGVEAGRRAGMRVVWVPHPGLLDVYQDRVKEVLAGLTGEHKETDLRHTDSLPLAGSPGQIGSIDDGWAEKLVTLQDFDYPQYGIDVTRTRYRSESGQPAQKGTTDKELEEMTARADGKTHAVEEGSRSGMDAGVGAA